MNEMQRYNLQKGIKEDRRFEATTYISDGSPLDNYLLQKAKNGDFIRGQMEMQKQEKELEKQLEKTLEESLDKLLKQLDLTGGKISFKI